MQPSTDTPPEPAAATEATAAPAAAVLPIVVHEHDHVYTTVAKATVVGLYAGFLVATYSGDRHAVRFAALGGFLGYFLVKSL